MFTDSLLETSWCSGSHRLWTTLTSFTLQALALAILLASPILYTQGLPQLALLRPLIAPTPPPAAPAPSTASRPSSLAPSNIGSDHRLLLPPRIPDRIANIHDESSPPPIPLGAEGIRYATGEAWPANSVLGSILGHPAAALPPPPTASAQPVRPSSVMEANLVHRVQPAYPPLARVARIQGAVVLQAIISKSGAIENLQVLNGHPMLVRSAMDAVRQWRYRPYLLNGEPVEVETQITVNFVLSGG
ncbi:MAG TPA: energy transducer TonB [Terriglobales bacterium]|nr:energy transducer TonB [Terriglobales bacterium]